MPIENFKPLYFRDADDIRAILSVLDKYGLPFLPMLPSQKARADRTLAARNIKPYAVSGIGSLKNRAITFRRLSYENIGYKVVYLDDDGLWSYVPMDKELLIPGQATQDPAFPLISYMDIDQLPFEDVYYFNKRLNAPAGINRENFNTAVAKLLRMPDKIGDVEIDESYLRRAIHESVKKDPFDADVGDPDILNAVNVGNALTKAGLTPLDYIRARYSASMMPGVLEHYQCNGPVNLHPACLELVERRVPGRNVGAIWTAAVENICGIDIDDEAYRVLTKVNAPIIERYRDNPNKKSFDLVRIFLGVKSVHTHPYWREFIHTHQRDIAAIALNKIAASKRFAKYGVPVSFLRLTSMTLTAQSELELIFELKTAK